MANTTKTVVYFVPGLAAGKEIFEYISLPNHLYDVRVLEWIPPHKNESIKQYAQRMANLIIEKNIILIGVSFGGVMVQEMSFFLKTKKTLKPMRQGFKAAIHLGTNSIDPLICD